MQKQPLVTAVLTSYNKCKYIKRAIESVLSQSYKNIELVIIDDASTDGTLKIISKIIKNESGITLLSNKINIGLTKSLNRAISTAKGFYIARLDDEDFWSDKKKIEKQVNFLEKNPDYALVGGGAIKIDKQGREIIKYLLPEKDKDIRKAILVDNAFAHVSVLFRKDIWEKIGGYDERFDGVEDMDLWLKIGKISKFYNFQEFFVTYTGHEHNELGYAGGKYSKEKRLKLNLKLRKKYSHFYPHYIKAVLLCMASYFYYSLPKRQKFWPLLIRVRTFIFGAPAYEYFEAGVKNKK